MSTDDEMASSGPEATSIDPGAGDGDTRPHGPGPTTDEEIATYLAAKGFLASAWMGAVLLSFSYAQLYWALLSQAYPGTLSLPLGILAAALGGWMFHRSRKVWLALDPGFGRRSMGIATLVAGAGGIFWLLFVLLAVLWYGFGVEIMPVT